MGFGLSIPELAEWPSVFIFFLSPHTETAEKPEEIIQKTETKKKKKQKKKRKNKKNKNKKNKTNRKRGRTISECKLLLDSSEIFVPFSAPKLDSSNDDNKANSEGVTSAEEHQNGMLKKDSISKIDLLNYSS